LRWNKAITIKTDPTHYLKALPDHLHERTRVLNRQPVRYDGEFVLYWMHHAVRDHENPALDTALSVADRLKHAYIERGSTLRRARVFPLFPECQFTRRTSRPLQEALELSFGLNFGNRYVNNGDVCCWSRTHKRNAKPLPGIMFQQDTCGLYGRQKRFDEPDTEQRKVDF
jgi:hypothetical protein